MSTQVPRESSPVDAIEHAASDFQRKVENDAAESALGVGAEVAPVEEPRQVGEAEPAAVVESAAPSVDLVAERLGRIEDKLAESQRLVDRHADIAAKLHAENQVLRAGELRNAQAALVLNVLRVFDDVSHMAATTKDPAARNDLVIVADALADALARNGIDAVDVAPGEPFDAKRHKIAAIEDIVDADADRTVVRVVRPGFVWADGDIVRVSDVAVYKHTPPEPPSQAPAESPSPADIPAAQ